MSATKEKRRNEMLARTHTMVAPWTVVRADNKPLARISLIPDLLTRSEFKGKKRDADLPDPDIVFNLRADVRLQECVRRISPTTLC
jgi:hypothetical protein